MLGWTYSYNDNDYCYIAGWLARDESVHQPAGILVVRKTEVSSHLDTAYYKKKHAVAAALDQPFQV